MADTIQESHSSNPVEELGRAFVYNAFQKPVNGVLDTVDHIAGTHLMDSAQFIDAPSQQKPFGLAWHAQQIGAAGGLLFDYLVLDRVLHGAGKAEALSAQSMIARSATNGFVLDSLFQPGDQKAQGLSYWLGRADNGIVGAGTFAALTGGSIALGRLAAGYEGTMAGTILKNRAVAGVATGLPVGALSAEIDSRLKTGEDASWQKIGESAYTMGVVGGILGPIGKISETNPEAKSFTIADAVDGARAKATQAWNSVDSAVASVNPFLPELALAGATADGARADVMLSKALENKGSGSDSRGGSGRESRTEAKSIKSILAGSDFDGYADAFDVIAREHPDAFGGLKAARDGKHASGSDSVAIELAPGKYKDAMFRMMGLPEADPEGRPYLDWEKDWGYRPYDAQLLSDVHEVTLPNGKQVFAFVQEKAEPLGVTGKERDMVDDANFSAVNNDPRFDELMAQMEERGERFVDPGSRQLGISLRTNRMVLLDYPSVRQSDTARPSDVPEDFAEHEDKHGATENPEDYGFYVGDLEQRRAQYLESEPRNQKESMQKEIASQIFDGASERDIAPYIEWMYKDYLESQKLTVRDAIAQTRKFLKSNSLD